MHFLLLIMYFVIDRITDGIKKKIGGVFEIFSVNEIFNLILQMESPMKNFKIIIFNYLLGIPFVKPTSNIKSRNQAFFSLNTINMYLSVNNFSKYFLFLFLFWVFK